MFSLDMSEKQTNRVDIKDFSSSVIRTSLATMYTGYLSQSPIGDHEHLLEVARFGDKYGMQSLVSACCSDLYLETNLKNVVDILLRVNNANFKLDKLRENLIGYVAR
jgi:hypothetical protein